MSDEQALANFGLAIFAVFLVIVGAETHKRRFFIAAALIGATPFFNTLIIAIMG